MDVSATLLQFLTYIQWLSLHCYAALSIHRVDALSIHTVDAAVLLYSLKLHIDIHTVDAAVLLYSLNCILTYIQWMLLYCHTA